MKKRLDDLDEMALRQFLDDRGKGILEFIMEGVLQNQRRAVLQFNVSDEESERRFIAEKHRLTGAEMLSKEFFVQVHTYSQPSK